MVTKTSRKTINRKKPMKPVVSPKQQSSKSIVSEKKDLQEIIDLQTKHLCEIDEMLKSLHKELKDIQKLVVSDKKNEADKPDDEDKPISDFSWQVLIDPNQEYTTKEVSSLTKIPPSTLSTAKGKGLLVTKNVIGKRGWVVLGSDLLVWDQARPINAAKNPVVSKGKEPVDSKAPVKNVHEQKKSQPTKSKSLVVQTPVNITTALTVQKDETKDLTTPALVKSKPKKSVKAPVVVTGTEVKKPGSKTPSETFVLIPEDIIDRINALWAKKKVNLTQFGNEVDLPMELIYDISSRKLKTLSQTSIQKISTGLEKYESK